MGEYDIGGDSFTLMDGIVGLTHSPAQGLVYYQPLATDRLFSVSTAVLASGPPAEGTDLPVNLVGRKSSQGLGIAVDPRDDTIIFSPIAETAIAAWNPLTNSHKVLAQDPEKLQFCAEVRCGHSPHVSTNTSSALSLNTRSTFEWSAWLNLVLACNLTCCGAPPRGTTLHVSNFNYLIHTRS
ncbi:major royal jelly protein domain-containing protein [Phthorimaea operculella]|nr:major royal jelly protein domain-containing protein [Phthorimaea operculella]